MYLGERADITQRRKLLVAREVVMATSVSRGEITVNRIKDQKKLFNSETNATI